MAIKGKLNFKGIELPEAYINIKKIQWTQKKRARLSCSTSF